MKQTSTVKRWLRVSVVLNAMLALSLAYVMYLGDFNGKLLANQSQALVELEGLIGHQQKNGWNEPQLVIMKLDEIRLAIFPTDANGTLTGQLRSRSDRNDLGSLYSALYRYPSNELYKLATVTEEDKLQLDKLRDHLSGAGFQLNASIGGDWSSYITGVRQLTKRIHAEEWN
ncbi:hypothetical protein [Paenibacillus sp. NPDC058071]|uniref:hypothetical protein n=1 Tax=Paenibacillus sp. NPDC058071 TaxID=3346326 RepID=UPI0036D98CB3